MKAKHYGFDHSYRSASIGAILDARRAGQELAASTTATRTAAEAPSTAGSRPDSPYSSVSAAQPEPTGRDESRLRLAPALLGAYKAAQPGVGGQTADRGCEAGLESGPLTIFR
ncbi:MAG TPA: hypothetical protein VMR74_07280 [Gammaproteobacteria bacterium]|nr:hypothetical protein [Gammaproteobacteria bacterium]